MQVRVTERFVEIINAHEGIRPYLRDYPWDYNRADVMITFYQDDGTDYPEGIRLIFVAKKQICYYGPEKDLNGIEDTIKEEPYLEAKNIVINSPSCLKPMPPKKEKKWWFF